MARIEPPDLNSLPADIRERLEGQKKAYGRPFEGSMIMARRPSIARAWADMFAGVHESGLLERGLIHLINRRVAQHVGCPF